MMNDPAGYQPGDAVLRVKTDMTLKILHFVIGPLQYKLILIQELATSGEFGRYLIFNRSEDYLQKVTHH